MHPIHIAGTATPSYRYKLKAKLVSAGFRSSRQFAEAVGINEAYLSRVLNGWQLPGPQLQRKFAQELGVTLRELREMLGG